jgi:hypothetical protein
MDELNVSVVRCGVMAAVIVTCQPTVSSALVHTTLRHVTSTARVQKFPKTSQIMSINAKSSMRKPDLLVDQPPPTSDLRADHHLTSTRKVFPRFLDQELPKILVLEVILCILIQINHKKIE